MPSYPFRDGEGNLKYATVVGGTGTSADPYVLSQSAASVTAYTHTTPAITDAGATVLAANTARKGAIIVNRSSVDTVELFLTTPFGAYGTGLPLAPGQPYEINSTNLYVGAITARTATGITVNLAVVEGV
jgi:hypothetical protein